MLQRKCRICTSDFEASERAHVVCSPECAEVEADPFFEPHCLGCGAVLPAKKGRGRPRKFCSDLCSQGDDVNYHINQAASTEFQRRKQDSPEDFARVLLIQVRGRAKAKGIFFNLEIGDIPSVPEMCPILGIPLLMNCGRTTTARDHAPSLDRIYPQRGYVAGNVRIISNRANRIKNNATPEELRLIAGDVEKYEEPDSSFWLERHLEHKSAMLNQTISFALEIDEMSALGYDLSPVPIEGIPDMVELRWVLKENLDEAA